MHTTPQPASPETPAAQPAQLPATQGKSGRLLSMGITYAMGTFNDNLFKQAALLLAAVAGLTHIQGQATILFALPFVLFSAWAGWLADQLPKSKLVLWAKILELAAMAAAVWSLTTMSWAGMMLVVFIMGLQSTLFSPALNGSIPELFPAHQVPRVNAFMKLATTATILLGIAMAGILLDLPNAALPGLNAWLNGLGLIDQHEAMFGLGRVFVGGVAVLVAIIGVLAAFGMGGTTAAKGEKAPFPLLACIDSARHALQCRKHDPSLYVVLAAEAFFYGLSSFAVLCINNLGVRQLGFSLTVTSLLPVALMVGICAGSVIAGKHGPESWRRFMLPAGLGMAGSLILVGVAPWLPPTLALCWLLCVFVATGVAGGLYLIPLISFIQVRPKATEKGKILGISNFASFSGIIISGAVLAWAGDARPSLLLVSSGLVALLFFAWAAHWKGQLPDATLAERAASPLGFLLRALLSLRYTIRVSGLEALPATGGILFLPNHPALIDPIILYSRLAGLGPRPLADENQFKGPLAQRAAKAINAVLIPDMRKDGSKARQGVEAGMQKVVQALKDGDNVLFYPSGRVYRSSREVLGGNSGLASIIQAMPHVRIVLVRTTGLWGSSFGYGATGKNPVFAQSLLRGFGRILGNLLFFTPRRKVTIEFVEPVTIPRDGDRRTLNPWLEAFYNEAERPAVAVPTWFWQGSTPKALPGYQERTASTGSTDTVPDELRARVYAALRMAAHLDAGHPLEESASLGADLGLDSLALMEFGLGLEQEFGHSVTSLEQLVTVGDCLLAASGTLAPPDEIRPAPAQWFNVAAHSEKLAVAEGVTSIPQAFVKRVGQAPRAILAADRSGIKSRRDMLTGALILARRFRALPGKRLGIMLPSAPPVVSVWLAALLAGKEPVFFNWTVGETNLRHCICLTGVSHIVSASALLDRLERQGLPLAGLPVAWVRLEQLAATLSLPEKLLGVVRARLAGLASLARLPGLAGVTPLPSDIPETAAVLFTSGSESLPKAVPLTHANLLANARDIIEVLQVRPDESVLSMLPPFHSFGLMVGLVLPLALGLRAVYHPNPTESAQLVALMRDFTLSLMAAPPTFLDAMLQQAKEGDLASLRFAFVGAEKCSEKVYTAFAARCPGAALCEGYGITECSPVVSVNRPGNVQQGTIGHALPSLELALVKEENGFIAGRAEPGATGMLLVRGPSIFTGYIGDSPSPFVEFEGHRWYRTGDLVSLDTTGRITFQGRLKRFVKIGGEMISLPQIENTLLEALAEQVGQTGQTGQAGLTVEGPALAVEATPEDTGAEIVLFTPLPLDLREINSLLRKAGLSPLYAVKRIVKLEAIPLLGSGKTDYQALKRLL